MDYIFLYYTSLHKINVFISNVVVIVGLKFLLDLFDMLCNLVVYITYNMGNQDLPDIICPCPLAWAYIGQISLVNVITIT